MLNNLLRTFCSKVQRGIRTAAPALVILFLSSCALMPQQEYEQNWAGRFSLQTVVYGQADRNSGNFKFSVNKNASELSLYGPLGITLAEIYEDDSTARLKRPDEPTVTAGNVEELMVKTVGFPIPVRELSEWLNGRPIPDKDFRLIERSDTLERFSQGGWLVSVFKNGGHPVKIEIRNAEPTADLSIKLILLIRSSKL